MGTFDYSGGINLFFKWPTAFLATLHRRRLVTPLGFINPCVQQSGNERSLGQDEAIRNQLRHGG